MSLPKLKLYNTSFAHGTSVGNGDLKIHPKRFEWDRTGTGYDTCIITEEQFHLVDEIPEARKIGWLIEPMNINPDAYLWIYDPKNHNKFDFVMTHRKSLIQWFPDKFIYQGLFGTWILPEERQLYPKTKSISIIASNKQMADGHRLRWDVINQFGGSMDIYGRGHNFIESKLQGLKDYRFQVVIENERSDGWITEKLIDCFVTGTIPIYYGCPDVKSTFNERGMYQFSNMNELARIIKHIEKDPKELYKICNTAMHDNFERAKGFVNTEDVMYENILKPKGILK